MPFIMSKPVVSGTPSATRWRIIPHGGQKGDSVFIGNIYWATTAGGAQAATGGTAVTSLGTMTGTISNAFDGNTGTWCNTAADNSDICDYSYTFSSAIQPYEVRIQAGTSGFASNPIGFTVQYYNGSTWVSYRYFTGISGPWTSGQTNTYVLSSGIPITTGVGRTNAKGWRLNITADNGLNQATVAELVFAATVGGSALTPAGYTCSANHNGFTRPASLAFDGSLGASNFWSTNNNPVGRIGAAFSAAQDIAQVRITMGANDLTGAPKDFTIQYTEDFVTWTTVSTQTGITGWSNGVAKTYSV